MTTEKKEKKYEELLLEVRRVTRVTTGGRRLSFRATILVGNRKGKIGLGIAKAQDVASAVSKATHDAYKNVVDVPLVGASTIPYAITYKYKSAIIKMIPAGAGTGLKAGSALRLVLGLAGYNNILSKIVGTNNKLNNSLAAIYALSKFKVDRSKLIKHEEEVEEIVEEVKEKKAPAKNAPKLSKPSAPKAKEEAPVKEEKKAPAKKPAPKAGAKKEEKAPVKKAAPKKTTKKE